MFALDIHPDTRAVADLLIVLPRGASISHDEITARIGRDIRQCRHVFYSAARLAQREAGATFATERGVGYRKLETIELASIGQTARSCIRRVATRGAKSIAAGVAGANDLTPATHRAILQEQTSLSLISHLARDRTVSTIHCEAVTRLQIGQATRDMLAALSA